MEKEKVLVSNTLNGDIDSFEALIEMYRNRIYNFLFKMTFSKEDSEDMTQEVFIRVYNSLYQYNKKWNFSTWIYKIAVNVFKTEYIKKKKRSGNGAQMLFDEANVILQNSTESILENRESKLEVLRMLNSLGTEQKAALVLKYVQGFSYKEIGEILKTSPENIKVKVMRAKRKLVQDFKEFEGGCE